MLDTMARYAGWLAGALLPLIVALMRGIADLRAAAAWPAGRLSPARPDAVAAARILPPSPAAAYRPVRFDFVGDAFRPQRCFARWADEVRPTWSARGVLAAIRRVREALASARPEVVRRHILHQPSD